MRVQPSITLLLFALTACGANTTHQGTVQRNKPAATSPSIATSAAPSPTTTTARSATPTLIAEPCRTADLRLITRNHSGATGHSGIYLTFIVAGAGSCTVSGYPRVSLVDRDGGVRALGALHGGSFVFTDPGPATVTLVPGQSATSGLGFSDTTSNGSPSTCQTVKGLAAQLPGGSSYLTASLPYPATICGTPGVTALQAGTAVSP